MRFLQQRCSYSCGPIALMNALIASGKSIKYSDIPFYRDLVDCDKDGTYPSNLSYGLSHFFKVHISKKSKIYKFKLIVLKYSTPEGDHVCLLTRVKDKWKIVNGEYKKKGYRPKILLTSKDLKSWLRLKSVECFILETL